MHNGPYNRPYNRQKHIRQKHIRQTGFGLVELMVAILISLLALASLGFVFVTARDVFQAREGTLRIQENGRFAIEIMSRDIRHAGYFGCIRADHLQRHQEYQPNLINGETNALAGMLAAVEGFDNGGVGTTWLPGGADLPANVQPSSDGITIRFANPEVAFTLSQNMVVPSDDVNLAGTGVDVSGWKTGKIVVISNCDAIDQFRFLAKPSNGKEIETSGLSAAYSEGTPIRELKAVRYYVATTDCVATLRRQELTNKGREAQPVSLINGIESLQILYGRDTTGDGIVNVYQRASDLGNTQTASELGNTNANWATVISVQIAVLANSVEEYGKAVVPTTGYEVLDETLVTEPACTSKANRLRRKIFSTTIALRQQ